MRHKHSRVSDPNEFRTRPGNHFDVQYSSRINSDGTITLTESGRENIQDRINSRGAECDMALIIKRLSMGDTSVLTTKPPIYGDFTQFPKSYAECLNLVQRSEKAFEMLDPDVKEKFDNDRNKWFASIGSDFWLETMGFVQPSPSESEVTE